MTKPELGRKHTCKSCEARFFDLNKTPPVCPKCGEEVKVSKPKPKRPTAAAEETAGEGGQGGTTAPAVPQATDGDGGPDGLEDPPGLEDLDDDLDDDPDDDDLMEDTSDMGEDNDDMSEVLEHVDSGVEDK